LVERFVAVTFYFASRNEKVSGVAMIIWSGFGFLAAVIWFGSLLLTQKVVNDAMGDPRFYTAHGWPKLLGFWIAAAICGPLGLWLNRDGQQHTMFFIPVQYWSPIFAVLGIVFLFI
jgi:hypothetical protein